MNTLFSAISNFFQRIATRNQLAQLDDRMLRDIGIGRSDIDYIVSGRNPR